MRDKISNDLRLRIKLGNISRKSQSRWEADSGAQSLFQKKDFDHSSKKIRTNWYQFFFALSMFFGPFISLFSAINFFPGLCFQLSLQPTWAIIKKFFAKSSNYLLQFFQSAFDLKSKKEYDVERGKGKKLRFEIITYLHYIHQKPNVQIF